MQPQTRLLYFLAILLLANVAIAQTKFAQDGKLLELNYNNNKLKKENIDLQKLDTVVKKDAREILQKKVKETINNLNNTTTGLHKFYDWLWGKEHTDKIIKELNIISEALGNTSNSSTNIILLKQFNNSIEKKLYNKSDNAYNVDIDKDALTLSLKLNDPFNNFLIHFYNNIYDSTAAEITAMNFATWYKYNDSLSTKKLLVDSLLNTVYSSSNTMDIPLFQKIRTTNRELQHNNSFYTKAKLLLNNAWFKNWIWMHNGLPRLNPLDFTTDDFLAKHPEYNIEKSKIYEEYIDTAIKRFIRLDTAARIDQFKKILAEKGTSKDLFKLTKRQDAIDKNNNKMMELLISSKILNQVAIPKTTNPFYNYSFFPNDNFKAIPNCIEYPTTAIRTTETKTVVIHNIKQGQDAFLKVKTTLIADRSAFQEGLDTLASFAGQIASLVIKFSPYSLLTPGGFIKTDNNIITRSTIYGGSTKEKNDDGYNTQSNDKDNTDNKANNNLTTEAIVDDLEKYLKAHPNDYDEETFINLRKSLSGDKKVKLPVSTDVDKYLKIISEKYFIILKNSKEQYFTNLRQDSLNLSFMQAAFFNSSLPPAKLKAKADNTAAYYSKILNTEPVDQSVKNDVTILGFKSKTDSITVAKFSYKVGKTYRFQLGAGIAYTFGNFIQTSATDENGKIIIKNTAQYYRLIAGLHIHFGDGLFLQDNRFLGRFKERVSFYIGVGMPKPLENIYTGFAYDFVPGLKTTFGIQLYRNNQYQIQNNVIIEDRKKYKYAGPFFAIQIDPASLLNFLNVIK